MKAKNVSLKDLENALKETNKLYSDNIEFNRYPEALNNNRSSWAFTLKVKDSSGPGHRRGFPPKAKRLAYACWHVHGHFFDALLGINPEAIIVTSGSLANPLPEDTITKNGGNWQDWRIGSQALPLMMSEACDCFGYAYD